MDIVFIERLHIDTIIGIYDWERQVRQTVTLDLEMAWDNTRPAANDVIDDALNYKAVAKRLTAFVEESRFGLVETLAERCAVIVREEFAVPWLRLRVRKPRAVRGSKAVGVEIERGTLRADR
jgi:dihydroneopterin aldolase